MFNCLRNLHTVFHGVAPAYVSFTGAQQFPSVHVLLTIKLEEKDHPCSPIKKWGWSCTQRLQLSLVRRVVSCRAGQLARLAPDPLASQSLVCTQGLQTGRTDRMQAWAPTSILFCVLFLWNTVGLQCCVSFWCIVKWFSRTCVCSLSCPPPLWLTTGHWACPCARGQGLLSLCGPSCCPLPQPPLVAISFSMSVSLFVLYNKFTNVKF